MRKNGTTSSGRQRWRCSACGCSSVRKIDSRAKRLDMFLRWLFSKATQADMGCSRATFKRMTREFWRIWPIAPFTGEVCDAVFLDGIWIGRDAVVLIACTREHVLAWHLARSECASAWAALMMRMPAPAMAVTDGAPGFAKAASAIWPATRIQRCTFHAFCQVRRCTTSRPKLDAGIELYSLARRLSKAKDANAAVQWLADYAMWCSKWEKFLREFTLGDGRKQYVHERLRKARRAPSKPVGSGELFTFVEMSEERGGEWDSTNNMIEGSANAQLREVLRLHRGLSTIRRIKAIFWWCYMHTESPLPPADILRVMPTDDQVEGLFASTSKKRKRDDGAPEEYGSGINWGEFHMPTRYRQ
ncbi:IS1249 family transposase [Adlercreutzia mucosicola]|uniref:IS1249 family transposase n=1 Tax=Adlercreutzia mucosicola TaxID=580026 RepID=UPI001F39275F|nr:IS1249 family transposase [Adlercreutzia mucosicola]MCR2035388.1 IS1249 family transposase [Adlercreutzia mucosicola]